tara:strand:+ start:84 stop:986 length:903 start_codon:yes stop_codon:yes gene_type:complete
MGDYSAGFPGSNFQYGTNAREVALSKSTLSTYNTGFNSFINPAALPDIKKNEYGFSYFMMSLDRSVQTLSISRPLPPSAGVSLSFFRSGTDNIVGTSSDFGDVIGNLVHSEGYGMLSFGINLGSLSGGFNIKAYFNNLDEYSGNGIGFDLGTLYKLNERISFALKLNNLSGGYSWDIDSEKYEEDFISDYSFGMTYHDGDKLLVSSQVDFVPIMIDLDKDEMFKIYRFGVEYILNSINIKLPIALRSGVRASQGDIYNSLGFGVPVKLNNKMMLNIDYAIDPGLVNEGISHLFSLTLLNY